MKEAEEKIGYFHGKITGVIIKRKCLMEDIILDKRKELEKNISMKKREMQNIIDSMKDEVIFYYSNLSVQIFKFYFCFFAGLKIVHVYCE